MNCVIAPTTDLNECDDGEIKNKDVVIALVDGFRLLSTSPLYSEILVDPVHRRLKHLHEQPVRSWLYRLLPNLSFRGVYTTESYLQARTNHIDWHLYYRHPVLFLIHQFLKVPSNSLFL